jgi:hypothetical protein
VREPEIAFVRVLGLTVAVWTIGSLACKSESPANKAGPIERAASTAEPEPKPASTSGAAKAPIRDDPERADKLADLDAMCKALNHDYDDGTLTDYYRDIQPKTAWGKKLREAGNESIQPGRLLEKAMTELSAGANEPALGNCRTLLDYLDDVE